MMEIFVVRELQQAQHAAQQLCALNNYVCHYEIRKESDGVQVH